jgi:hypothetical protein
LLLHVVIGTALDKLISRRLYVNVSLDDLIAAIGWDPRSRREREPAARHLALDRVVRRDEGDQGTWSLSRELTRRKLHTATVVLEPIRWKAGLKPKRGVDRE